MKLTYIYTFSLLLFGYFLFNSSSSGVAAAQRADKTGSPLAAGNGSFCQDCHSSGAFSPTISVKLLDGGNEVSGYEPGKSYQLKIELTAGSGNPGGFGFQSVVLDASNASVGTYGTPLAGTRVTSLNNRQYFEQARPSTSPSFEIDWIAPASGTGDVTVYAAGNAVNRDGNTTGDGAAKTQLTLPELTTSNSSEIVSNTFTTKVLGNPVVENLFLEVASLNAVDGIISLFNADGKIAFQQVLRMGAGENGQFTIPMQSMPSGVYFLAVRDKEDRVIQRIVKQ